jgi:hypothetical protein
MADTELIDALSGLDYAPVETGWGIGAQSIAQALPSLTNPYASPISNLGVTLGGALVASLLGYQARKEAFDMGLQTQKYANQLMRLETPEARTSFLEALPSDVAGTAISGRLGRLSTALGRQQALQNALLGQEKRRLETLAPLEVDIARAKELGVSLPGLRELDQQRKEQRAALLTGALSATTPSASMPSATSGDLLTKPEAYQFLTKPEREAQEARQKLETQKKEQADALRKEFSSLPEVKDYSLIDTASRVVAQAVKDPSAVATQELVRRAVQLIEPGMAVREGEQAAIMNSQSIPDQFKGEMERALVGEGGLSEETRAGIMRIAERAYRAQSQKYKATKDYYEGLAKERQLPSRSVSYLGDPASWESIAGGGGVSKQEKLKGILQQLQSTVDPTEIAALKQRAADIYKEP